jgi:hypothetical protein
MAADPRFSEDDRVIQPLNCSRSDVPHRLTPLQHEGSENAPVHLPVDTAIRAFDRVQFRDPQPDVPPMECELVWFLSPRPAAEAFRAVQLPPRNLATRIQCDGDCGYWTVDIWKEGATRPLMVYTLLIHRGPFLARVRYNSFAVREDEFMKQLSTALIKRMNDALLSTPQEGGIALIVKRQEATKPKCGAVCQLHKVPLAPVIVPFGCSEDLTEEWLSPNASAPCAAVGASDEDFGAMNSWRWKCCCSVCTGVRRESIGRRPPAAVGGEQ